jgi:hypothetical protein
MKKIRRNILKVFLRPILVLIFTSSIGVYGIKSFIKILHDKNENLNYTLYISFGACFLFIIVGIYELYNRLKKAPKISISEKYLVINKNKFLLKDINEIKLTGKFYFQSEGRYKIKELMFREGMEIKFFNGKIIHIFEEFYENLNELKLKLKDKFTVNKITEKPILNFKNQKYRNYQFFKLRGIITWSIISYLLLKNVFLSNSLNLNGKIFTIIICLIIFFWQSKFMYYFIFENNKMIIKNENYFWSKKIIELNDIEEVVFEKDVMLYDFLKRKHMKVILKNHKQYKFGADLLKNNMWNNLKKQFEDIHIKTRNEF